VEGGEHPQKVPPRGDAPWGSPYPEVERPVLAV